MPMVSAHFGDDESRVTWADGAVLDLDGILDHGGVCVFCGQALSNLSALFVKICVIHG